MSVDHSRRSLLLSAAGVGGMTAAALAVSMPDAAAAVGTTGWLNVMADFGAKGDGATDDTAAIQAALNAVPVGGVVYFPNGVYEISAPLAVQKAGTKLLGDKASTGYSAGGSNQTTIDALPGFAHPAMIQAAGIADFAMRDLTVHGPSTTGTTVGIQLTRVNGVGSCMLENVLVARTAGDGIVLQDQNPAVLRQVGVYHAGTAGSGSGFVISGVSDSWYTDCLAAGSATAGWNITGGDNSTWIGCRAEDGPGYGFWFHDVPSLFGGISFVGCSTDLNGTDGFRLDSLGGNGVIQLNGCQFRRDGNNGGQGSTDAAPLAGIAVHNCTIPVVLDGTTVTARQGDHGGADAPHIGLNVSSSTYVSVNGGYLSCESTGSPIRWDQAGALPIGPNVLTATVTTSNPALALSQPWNTPANSQFAQAATADTSLLVQTLSGVTTNSNPLIHQHHPAPGTRAIGLDVTGDPSMRWVVLADGTQSWGSGTDTRDTSLKRLNPAVLGTPDSDLEIGMPGKGLRIAEGTNAKMGVTTLNGTTPVTVSTTAVTVNSRIFLTIQKPGGTPGGIAYVASHGAGSFSIAGAAGDKSTVAWLIIEPA